jgi:hypothetical protein
MVCMLLTERTVCVCQYWTYGRGKEGMFLSWGLTYGDIDLLRGMDCDILTQGLQTWPRGDVPVSGFDRGGCRSSKGVYCDILTQDLIGLIEYSYH